MIDSVASTGNEALNNALWQEAYGFWFVELKPKQWFMSTAELDKTITERFSKALQALTQDSRMPPVSDASLTECSIHTARDTLAAILLTDQFSRNIHRGSKHAFATDALALSLAHRLVASDALQNFTPAEIQFSVMPYMHSETLGAQEFCVAQLTEFGIELALPSALEHQELIQRFGRFPHRNELLGRDSTKEELAYLKTGKTFGQG